MEVCIRCYNRYQRFPKHVRIRTFSLNEAALACFKQRYVVIHIHPAFFDGDHISIEIPSKLVIPLLECLIEIIDEYPLLECMTKLPEELRILAIRDTRVRWLLVFLQGLVAGAIHPQFLDGLLVAWPVLIDMLRIFNTSIFFLICSLKTVFFQER
jgi:hypothetical protein